jgi:hypothetical protein
LRRSPVSEVGAGSPARVAGARRQDAAPAAAGPILAVETRDRGEPGILGAQLAWAVIGTCLNRDPRGTPWPGC